MPHWAGTPGGELVRRCICRARVRTLMAQRSKFTTAPSHRFIRAGGSTAILVGPTAALTAVHAAECAPADLADEEPRTDHRQPAFPGGTRPTPGGTPRPRGGAPTVGT